MCKSDTKDSRTFPVNKLVVGSIRASMRSRICADLAKHNPSLSCERVADELIIGLRAYIAALPFDKICIYHKYPKDWWEALKERWFPEWAKKRWPVEYVVIDIHEYKYAVCPHVPTEGTMVHYEWLKGASMENPDFPEK